MRPNGRTIFHYPSQHPVDRVRRAAAATATLSDRVSVYASVNGLSRPSRARSRLAMVPPQDNLRLCPSFSLALADFRSRDHAMGGEGCRGIREPLLCRIDPLPGGKGSRNRDDRPTRPPSVRQQHRSGPRYGDPLTGRTSARGVYWVVSRPQLVDADVGENPPGPAAWSSATHVTLLAPFSSSVPRAENGTRTSGSETPA